MKLNGEILQISGVKVSEMLLIHFVLKEDNSGEVFFCHLRSLRNEYQT